MHQRLGERIHHYEIPIRPHTPLRVGLRVKVMAISRVAYHAPSVVFPRYETYDPHVAGTIQGVVEVTRDKVTFVVENECAINPVTRVKLTVKWIPGITAQIPDEASVVEGCSVAVGGLEEDVGVAAAAQTGFCGKRCTAGVAPASVPWLEIVSFE